MVSENHVVQAEPCRLQRAIVGALRQVARIQKPPAVVDEGFADAGPTVQRISADDLQRVVEDPAVAQARQVGREGRQQNCREYRGYRAGSGPTRMRPLSSADASIGALDFITASASLRTHRRRSSVAPSPR